MKPDRPGEWHSRDGRAIVVFDYCCRLVWQGRTDTRPRREMHELQSDDWLPAIAPTFPELPPKPGLVLFTQEHWGPSEVYWGTVDNGILYVASPKSGHGATYNLAHAKIVVVPHDDNDDEAVKLIEEAKRG